MRHRTGTFVLSAVLLCSTILPAQEKPANTPVIARGSSVEEQVRPTPDTPAAQFESKSQLVLVPVVVSRSGVPVSGLTKEQFKIYENGKEQKISVFEEVKSDSSPVNVTRVRNRQQKTFSNMQVDQASAKRLVVVVLDLINTRFEDRVYARQQLIKFLSDNVDHGALISLVALGRGRVKVIHDFTSNPDTLVAALTRVTKKGPEAAAFNSDLGVAESQVFESEVNSLTDFLENGQFSGARAFGSGGGVYRWFRIRETLDGMNLIAQAYAGVPGRKALIWATGGFPFQIDGSTMLLDPKMMGNPSTQDLSDILDYYEQTWQLMNNANFAIYPVDLRGLVVNNISASERVANPRNLSREIQRRNLLQMDTIATFGTFADMTGGRAFYNTNDLAGSFKKATIDSGSYYMLAYYLDRGDKNGKNDRKKDWRKLKVKVDAPTVSVRARSGFFANQDQQSFKNEIALALSSPLDFTGLPVTVHWLDEPPADAKQAKTAATTESQKPNNSEKKTGFEVFVPANLITVDGSDGNKLSLEVVASPRTSTGTQVNGVVQNIDGHLLPETVAKMRTSGFLFRSDLSLPPGRYSVRFVVHDNIGQRTGSVAAPLVVN